MVPRRGFGFVGLWGGLSLPLKPAPQTYNKKVMQASVEQAPPQPLSVLTEDEKMFQSTVRRFARTEIAPHVREMDEAGVFRKDIIRQFFELGKWDYLDGFNPTLHAVLIVATPGPALSVAP